MFMVLEGGRWMKNRIVRFINAIFPIDDEQESSRIYDNSTIMEEMYKSDGKYYEIRNEWKRVYFYVISSSVSATR